MRTCKTQCRECPFRRTSLRGWLGGYGSFVDARVGVQSIFGELWHGQPFFCHTRTDYSRRDWLDRALTSGELCLGALLARHDWGMPDAKDPVIARAERDAVAQRAAEPDSFDVLPLAEWKAHHESGLDSSAGGP